MNIRFECNSCGKCCHDRHIPLTLSESQQWAANGGQVIIIAEAFLADGYGLPEVQREHAQRRSVMVRCGDTHAYVSITFAVYNVGACRYLTPDNRCGIYRHRPLVCRIYPIEINPHIQLRPEHKECSPETWQTGPEILRDGRLVNSELSILTERFRQADRDEISIKAAICEHLGINIAALKGDGFATYLPKLDMFLTAIQAVTEGDPARHAPALQDWAMIASGAGLDELQSRGATTTKSLPQHGTFFPI
jgi:Fe-S-cluster containining protein